MKRIASADLAIILRGAAGLGSSRRAAEKAAARLLTDPSAASYQLAIEVLFATLTYGVDLGPYAANGERCGRFGNEFGTRTPTVGEEAASETISLAGLLLTTPDAWPTGPDPVQRIKDAYVWFDLATSKQSLAHDVEHPPHDQPYWRYWLSSLQCRGYVDDFGSTKSGREEGAEKYLKELWRQAGGTWKKQVWWTPMPGGVLPLSPFSGPPATWHPLLHKRAAALLPIAAAALAEVWWLKAVSWEMSRYQAPIPPHELLAAVRRAQATLAPNESGRRRRRLFLPTDGELMLPLRRRADARGQRRLGTAVAATGAALAWALQRLR